MLKLLHSFGIMEGQSEGKNSDSKVDRSWVVYRCEYVVPPEVQKYYYHPDPGELDSEGKPILLGSPTFDGPRNTKWHVTTTFNRWVETSRWLPMYLTRCDNENIPQGEFQIQCEFRIVNEQKEVLHSMRSKVTSTARGRSRGFTKFLSFKDISKVLTSDNKLLIEAHITFFCAKWTCNDDDVTCLGYAMEAFKPDASCAAPLELVIQEYDIREFVRVLYGTEFLGYANRQKLYEKSAVYQTCVANWPECLSELMVNMGDRLEFESATSSTSDTEFTQRRMVIARQFLDFINADKCEVLNNGTYYDLKDLFEQAKIWETKELLSLCINAMSLKVPVDEACYHAILLREHCTNVVIDPDIFGHFRNFFRRNLRFIQRSSAYFRTKCDMQYFSNLAANPDFDLVIEYAKMHSNASPG